MRLNVISGVGQIRESGRALRRALPTAIGMVTLILAAPLLRANEINYVLADDGITATLTLQDYTPGPTSPLSNADFVSFNVIGSVNGSMFDYTVDEGQLLALSGVIDSSGETPDIIDIATDPVPNSLGGGLPDMNRFTEMEGDLEVLGPPPMCIPGQDCRGQGRETPILKKQPPSTDSWVAVPEPGSMSLMLLGLTVCLSSLRLNRSRRKVLRV